MVGRGLLFYLPETVVRSLLSTMASLSGANSALGTDTMSATMLASEERRDWVRFYAESGAPFIFGTDKPGELVAAFDSQPQSPCARDIGERLGRPWSTPASPGPPPGAILTATLV